MNLLTRDVPPRSAWALEQAGIHPLLARLYAARGVQSKDELDDALNLLLPPAGMRGTQEAAKLLACIPRKHMPARSNDTDTEQPKTHKRPRSGFVYAAYSDSNGLKLGMTCQQSPMKRIRSLNTAVSRPYTLVDSVRCGNPAELERFVHRMLQPWRVGSHNRELFSLNPRAASALFDAIRIAMRDAGAADDDRAAAPGEEGDAGGRAGDGQPHTRRDALAHEQPRQQQDDEEVDERHGGGGPQVELPHRLLRQVLRQEGGGCARASAGEYKRFGVDHETVHEAQQHGDHQHLHHRRRIAPADPTRLTVLQPHPVPAVAARRQRSAIYRVGAPLCFAQCVGADAQARQRAHAAGLSDPALHRLLQPRLPRKLTEKRRFPALPPPRAGASLRPNQKTEARMSIEARLAELGVTLPDGAVHLPTQEEAREAVQKDKDFPGSGAVVALFARYAAQNADTGNPIVVLRKALTDLLKAGALLDAKIDGFGPMMLKSSVIKKA